MDISMKTSRDVVEECLGRATDPEGEGRLAFLQVDAERASHAADAIDALREAGTELSPIAGLPVSVKDLLDVEGEVTMAASPQNRGRAPAHEDCPAVARLKRAGAVIVGRTNMTEFAFTGVGMNPHFGTPANPYDRAARRIPGGSSSGAVVSVTDGMALAAIGSDTGGSVRIPAALCGLAGFKPTQRRVPLSGVFPLSPTLDSVGPMARSVGLCAAVDAVLAAEESGTLAAVGLDAVRFAVATNYFVDGMDATVAAAYAAALRCLRAAGAAIAERAFPEMERIRDANARGGFSSPEAFAFHRRNGVNFEQVDLYVRERILRGGEVSAAEYIDLHYVRQEIVRQFRTSMAAFDCILCPTVPIVAPRIGDLEASPDVFRRTNMLLLRNPSVVNFLDGCALTIPCHREGDAPVGLMLIGKTMEDRRLLAIGEAVEHALAGLRDAGATR